MSWAIISELLKLAGGKLLSGARSALSFATKNPWPAACIALSLIVAVQWHVISHDRVKLKACESARKADAARYTQAQQEALKRAEAAKLAAENHYRDLAKDADDAKTQAVADARAAGEQYALTHRLPTSSPSGPAGGPAAPASSGDPGLPQGVPAVALVGVTDADVQACSEVSAYAVKAHDWAVTLGK